MEERLRLTAYEGVAHGRCRPNSAAEDTHDDYGDIHNDYSVHDKLAAIAALDFSGVIDYPALRSRAPTLEALEHSLTARSNRK
jgi:hypothetical protein